MRRTKLLTLLSFFMCAGATMAQSELQGTVDDGIFRLTFTAYPENYDMIGKADLTQITLIDGAAEDEKQVVNLPLEVQIGSETYTVRSINLNMASEAHVLSQVSYFRLPSLQGTGFKVDGYFLSNTSGIASQCDFSDLDTYANAVVNKEILYVKTTDDLIYQVRDSISLDLVSYVGSNENVDVPIAYMSRQSGKVWQVRGFVAKSVCTSVSPVKSLSFSKMSTQDDVSFSFRPDNSENNLVKSNVSFVYLTSITCGDVKNFLAFKNANLDDLKSLATLSLVNDGIVYDLKGGDLLMSGWDSLLRISTVEIPDNFSHNGESVSLAAEQNLSSSVLSHFSFLSLPQSVSELMVSSDGTTVDAQSITFALRYADGVVSLGNMVLDAAKSIIVPSAQLEAYRRTYARYADRFVAADALLSANDNVEYNGATNTLSITVGEGSDAAQMLSDVAVAVNAGAKNVENIVINITHDIDLSALGTAKREWTSIGTSDAPFSGKVVGNGYTVSGISSATGALFGMVGKKGSIDGLVLDAIVEPTTANAVVADGHDSEGNAVTAGRWIGLLADVNNGRISDVFATFDVEMLGVGPDDYLSIVAENNGALDHVSVVVFEGSKEGGNRGLGSNMGTTIKVGQGNGKGGSVTKCCLAKTRKLMQKGGVFAYDVPECNPNEVIKNMRYYDENEWASGEAAYWFNFDGEGYTGKFSGKYTFRNNGIFLAGGVNGATVRLALDSDSDSAQASCSRYANLGSTVTISYAVAPRGIGGVSVNLLSDTEATVKLPTTVGKSGCLPVTLFYNSNALHSAGAASARATTYDLAGREVSQRAHQPSGLYLQRGADGRSRRVIIR